MLIIFKTEAVVVVPINRVVPVKKRSATIPGIEVPGPAFAIRNDFHFNYI